MRKRKKADGQVIGVFLGGLFMATGGLVVMVDALLTPGIQMFTVFFSGGFTGVGVTVATIAVQVWRREW